MTDNLILFEIIAFEPKIIETQVYTMCKICEFLCVEAADEYGLCAVEYPPCFSLTFYYNISFVLVIL